MSITLSFLHNLVKAGHEHDLILAIFEDCVNQSKNSQCKQTHIKVKLNGPLSNHWITALGIPGGHQVVSVILPLYNYRYNPPFYKAAISPGKERKLVSSRNVLENHKFQRILKLL